MNVLPRFVPHSLCLTVLGDRSHSQVWSLRSDETRDHQSLPSPVEHVQSGDSALTSLTPPGFLLQRLLHCFCYVIHHGCRNSICDNITNKAWVPW